MWPRTAPRLFAPLLLLALCLAPLPLQALHSKKSAPKAKTDPHEGEQIVKQIMLPQKDEKLKEKHTSVVWITREQLAKQRGCTKAKPACSSKPQTLSSSSSPLSSSFRSKSPSEATPLPKTPQGLLHFLAEIDFSADVNFRVFDAVNRNNPFVFAQAWKEYADGVQASGRPLDVAPEIIIAGHGADGKERRLAENRARSVACFVSSWLRRHAFRRFTLSIGTVGKSSDKVHIFFPQHKHAANFKPSYVWKPAKPGSNDGGLEAYCGTDSNWKGPGFKEEWLDFSAGFELNAGPGDNHLYPSWHAGRGLPFSGYWPFELTPFPNPNGMRTTWPPTNTPYYDPDSDFHRRAPNAARTMRRRAVEGLWWRPTYTAVVMPSALAPKVDHSPFEADETANLRREDADENW